MVVVVVVVVVVVHVEAAMAEHVYGPHVIRLKRPHVPLHVASQDCPAHSVVHCVWAIRQQK